MAKEHHKNHGVLFDYNGVLVIGHEAASNLAAVLAALDGEFKLGIVTRSWRADVQRMLERENIAQYFHAIIAAEDLSASKPDPDGYLQGINALNLPAQHIVAVEDTPTGVQAAQAAGLRCIAVEPEPGSDRLAGAAASIKNLSELTPAFVHEIIAS